MLKIIGIELSIKDLRSINKDHIIDGVSNDCEIDKAKT